MTMDKRYIGIVLRCITVIIVLKLVMVTSTPISLSSLTKICCVDRGKFEIASLPNHLCTAIATYSQNEETTDADISSLRGKLPLVYIVNQIPYKLIKGFMDPDNRNELIIFLNSRITELKINVMIFDNFHPSEHIELHTKLQDNIKAFIIDMKNKNPDVIFGLALSPYKDVMENAFDLNLLNNVVDVFLAKTYSYNECEHEDHQSEMANTSPVEYMSTTLNDLTSLGYDLRKMLLTIRIIVNSARFGSAESEDDESYTSLCLSDPGKKRKFCKETLTNFYRKGLLVSSNKMLGCLIQSVDRDDHKNGCQCGNFPVLNCINAGLNGSHEPNITSCANFGLIPRDRV